MSELLNYLVPEVAAGTGVGFVLGFVVGLISGRLSPRNRKVPS